MVLSRLQAHVILVVAIRDKVSTLGSLMIFILWEHLVLIRQADLLLALLCLSFKHLLVLILNGLLVILDIQLDFLSLHHHRSCVSEVALL